MELLFTIMTLNVRKQSNSDQVIIKHVLIAADMSMCFINTQQLRVTIYQSIIHCLRLLYIAIIIIVVVVVVVSYTITSSCSSCMSVTS